MISYTLSPEKVRSEDKNYLYWKIVEYGEYCKSEETSVTYRVSWKSVRPFSSDAGPNTQTEKKNSKM